MRNVIEKLILYIILTGYYFIVEDSFSIIVVLVSFILIFSADIIWWKGTPVIILAVLTGLTIFSDDWAYYFPLAIQVVSYRFGVWSSPTLFIYAVFPDWILFSLTLAVMYITRLNSHLDSLEFENRVIRDQLTKDNLRLRRQHKELMKNHEKEVYMAGLNERNRIARDMHDALGHSLSSSILLIESLQYVKDPKKVQESLRQLQERLKTGMNDIRTSIHQLHDTSIDFESRVSEYINEMKHYTVDYQYQIDSNLPHHLKMDLLSFVREALTNITKHSNANTVTVLLKEHPQFITVSVKDNGSRYHSIDNGMGLQTMKETVQKYKGVFNTFYDKGFTVHIILYKEEVFGEDYNH